ncbi:MAG: hypothetical protein OXL37_01970 [Chloroflexota bacterium]|nr:hypothetical protein [Chloroflexota bacterium]MDE2961505.1 hypothetical protein [Chloroflexota bacterium]
MIVPDLNLLIYAYNDGAPQHVNARNWWETLLRGEETVGLPWIVTTGFVRLMANHSFVSSPLSPPDAADIVRNWFLYPHIISLNPGNDHLRYFRQNLEVPGSGPNLVTDAHIAALAMEQDAEVHTYNSSDFARFTDLGLRWRNPLREDRLERE